MADPLTAPASAPLTDEDLEELAHSVREGADPGPVIATLIAAVEAKRLADPDDASYALGLAADIAEASGDLEGALGHLRRAVDLGADDGYHQASVARLLLLIGREAEGTAVLDALRPQMATDWVTASGIIEALEDSGRVDLALEWTTDALRTAHTRWVALAGRRDDPEYRAVTAAGHRMCAVRARLRREQGLPPDELDQYLEPLQAAVDELNDDELDDDDPFEADPFVDGGASLVDDPDAVLALFWTGPDFDQLVAEAPALSTVYGKTWDEHRTTIESTMSMLSATGVPTLGLIRASFPELVAFAAIRGRPVTDEITRDDYAGSIEDLLAWPPPAAGPCWCGSGLAYQACCQPRSRPETSTI